MTLARHRVLVVEDDYLVSLATTDILESINCVIIGPVSHLAAAIQLARSDALDGAVLDIDIAGEKVWPVAEELQRRNVPFLFLSAYPPTHVVPVRYAAAPHLEKPLEQHRLLRHLSAMWKVPVANAR